MRFSGAFLYLSIMSLGLASGSHARADDDGSGFFVGGDVGRAPIAANNALYQSQLEASASGSGSLLFTKASLSKRDVAWSFDSGYMLWPYVGLEASYFHFGRVSNQLAGSFVPMDGTSEYVYAATLLESRGPALGLLFRLPLIESLDVDFRLADYYGHTTLTNTLIAAEHTSGTVTSNSSSLLAGIGMAYTFDGHWLAKLDYLHIGQAGSDTTMKYSIGMVSAGITYAF